jgi:hypothetical protein
MCRDRGAPGRPCDVAARPGLSGPGRVTRGKKSKAEQIIGKLREAPVELLEPLLDRLLGAGPFGTQGGDCGHEQGSDEQRPATDCHASHRVAGVRLVAWASARFAKAAW